MSLLFDRIARQLFAGCCSALALLSLDLPAAGQVKFSDLEGADVNAVIEFDQRVRRAGRTFPVRIQQKWKLSIRAENAIDLTVRSTARGPSGTRQAEPNTGTFTLDEPSRVRNRGGGDVLWTFAEETLTFTRTFPSGAFRAHFALANGPGGLTCTATGAFARERGKNDIQLDSPFGGGLITIVSARQAASTCKVLQAEQRRE